MHRRLLTVGMCLTVLLSESRQLHAQPAEELFKDAVVRFSMADFHLSIRLLKQAKLKAKDPGLLGRIYLYLGLNHAVIGQKKVAKKEFYTALIKNPGLSLDPKRFKLPILEMFNQVRQSMRGDLSVSADREAAVVLVDGKNVGQAPFKAPHTIGKHLLEVRSQDGRFGYAEEVIVSFDQHTQVKAKLKRLWGKLSVRSTPAGAEVLLDGRSLGNAPLDRVAVGAGGHQISLRLDGHREHSIEVDVPPDHHHVMEVLLRPVVEVKARQPQAVPAEPGRRVWTWVAAGAAVAAASVGIGLGISANSDYDEYQKTPDPEQGARLKDDIESKDLGANAMFGVAGALAITSVVLFFLEGRADEALQATESGGIAWITRF